jgi:hypothetical protein
MLDNSSKAPATNPPRPPDKAARTEPVPDPRAIIEVASDGTGSTNDGSATAKPPGFDPPGRPTDGL